MIPLKEPLIDASREKLFAEVVSAAFSQRRKTLRNTLRKYLQSGDYLKLGIDLNQRAENLSVMQFVTTAEYLDAGKSE